MPVFPLASPTILVFNVAIPFSNLVKNSFSPFQIVKLKFEETAFTQLAPTVYSHKIATFMQFSYELPYISIGY